MIIHIIFSALSDEEKTEIKGQLLLSFNEPVSQVISGVSRICIKKKLYLILLFLIQIASQLAVLISKIARVESKSWTELMPALLQVGDELYNIGGSELFTITATSRVQRCYYGKDGRILPVSL